MKKFIKSSLIAFALITAVIMNGCDAFENFLFGLPISFRIDAVGQNNPSGHEDYCLENNDTYMDYSDKLNSIVFVEAHMIVLSITPDIDIQGQGQLRLYEGNTPNPANELFTHTTPSGLNPKDYMSPKSYKLDLTQTEIDKINSSLANHQTCFYGDYQVTTNLNTPVTIQIRVDILYNIDSNL